jgi:hypothetical protein
VIAKYASNGLLDGLFGSNGIVKTSFGETSTGVSGIAVGPGRRFVAVGGNKFHTARYFDSGANLVYATAYGAPTGSEAGQIPASFFVFRSEILPTPTRVYFSIGGSARAPSFRCGGTTAVSNWRCGRPPGGGAGADWSLRTRATVGTNRRSNATSPAGRAGRWSFSGRARTA